MRRISHGSVHLYSAISVLVEAEGINFISSCFRPDIRIYMLGITNRVSNKEKSNPKTTTIPKETRLSAPAPMLRAIGKAPNMVASDVIKMGRRRAEAASKAASAFLSPALRF